MIPGKRFVLDVESTSECDLKTAGAAKYWEDPSTRVICVSYHTSENPGVFTWKPGDGSPYFLQECCGSLNWRVVAHNWLFEYNCWIRHLLPKYGWDAPLFNQWDCTMARALYWGLPAGLFDVAQALHLPYQIDPAKKARIKRMARPRSLSPLTWWDQTDPDKLKELIEDCEQDVRAEAALDDILPALPDTERKIFLLDGIINIRGIRIDQDMVDRLDRITAAEGARLNDRMAKLTDGRVRTTNQVAAISAELERLGVSVPSLAKADVATAIAGLDPSAVGLGSRLDVWGARSILECRQEAAKASTAKLGAMRRGASRDGRCRGLFQYGGAGRTLRWAGRRVQPQNYPRGTVKGVDRLFRILEQHPDTTADELGAVLPGSVMDAVSSMLRGCFIASPGHAFVSGDLSQIEARVVAWLAGQNDILAVFARGDDVYTYTAKGIGSDNRQLGKVLVLACIAEGEPVLTDRGLVPIELVTTDMRVWDGVEWVGHAGVVFRGEKEIIEHDGLRATPDHRVWTEGRGDPVPFGDAASTFSRLVRSGFGRAPLQGVGRAEQQQTKARVYDIIDAGPRHRFTVSGRLVSNCGFGMGVDKFRETAATYGITLTVEEAEAAVHGWRKLNARIVALWWDVDRIAKQVAQAPSGTAVSLGLLTFRKTKKALRIVLPSGRELTYQNVEVTTDEFGREELSYMGVDPKSKRWTRIRTYGGRLVENITQAVARDVMGAAMLVLDELGTHRLGRGNVPRLVGTVHDELLGEVIEAVAPAALDLMLKVLRTPPAWAPGLPVNAEGWTGFRYRK